MNERLLLPISILVNLMLHVAVLSWIMHLVQVRVHDGQEMLQVFLQNNTQS
jgi:hypothetical protein